MICFSKSVCSLLLILHPIRFGRENLKAPARQKLTTLNVHSPERIHFACNSCSVLLFCSCLWFLMPRCAFHPWSADNGFWHIHLFSDFSSVVGNFLILSRICERKKWFRRVCGSMRENARDCRNLPAGLHTVCEFSFSHSTGGFDDVSKHPLLHRLWAGECVVFWCWIQSLTLYFGKQARRPVKFQAGILLPSHILNSKLCDSSSDLDCVSVVAAPRLALSPLSRRGYLQVACIFYHGLKMGNFAFSWDELRLSKSDQRSTPRTLRLLSAIAQ